MPKLQAFKNDQGKLEGYGEKGRRAFQKFNAMVAGLEPGEMVSFEYRLPRSPRHHSYFFWKLNGLFESQEGFEDIDRMLDWLKCGSGFCDLLPGRDGVPCAIPASIAWDKADEQVFTEFHRAMTDFLWTEHAQLFLWPQLSAEARYECVETWHRSYEGRKHVKDH